MYTVRTPYAAHLFLTANENLTASQIHEGDAE